MKKTNAMFGFLEPSHMPCDECGASVARGEREQHTCEPAQKLEFELHQLRTEITEFDAQLSAYLRSPHGRFEVFYAATRRRPLQKN
jgi:hypothetical protein